MAMVPLDYGRSFLIGKWPENEVRFWVESRTRIIDERDGRTEDYVQCASCKSEDTFAEENLFYADNYDFLPIFGPEFGLIFRRKAWLNPEYRRCPKTEDMWAGQIYHLCECPSARELEPDAILPATREWYPLVAQTEISHAESGLRAIMEYPVKTMNTRRADNVYQIDTGPVAFPDLGQRAERLVDTLSLAFVAFNAPHSADVVVEEPTSALPPGTQGECRIHHYSRCLSLVATNRLFALA